MNKDFETEMEKRILIFTISKLKMLYLLLFILVALFLLTYYFWKVEFLLFVFELSFYLTLFKCPTTCDSILCNTSIVTFLNVSISSNTYHLKMNW